jgi:hypothetical protein
MVNHFRIKSRSRSEDGALITEIMIALAIIAAALMPLGLSYANDQNAVHRLYQKAVAMEIIDGEMEILLAGEWRSFKEGSQPYPVAAQSAKNLPSGRAQLTIAGKHLKLEWLPEGGKKSITIIREATAK